MLTDKQSIILCAVVVLGFSVCGILEILDNYAVSVTLLLLFLVVVVNLVFNKTPPDKEIKKERSK
ncbi:MAG: hypothetical protein GYB39_00725 [Algicola sp.]|nr:hypothetical protein [Algicola sp.]